MNVNNANGKQPTTQTSKPTDDVSSDEGTSSTGASDTFRESDCADAESVGHEAQDDDEESSSSSSCMEQAQDNDPHRAGQVTAEGHQRAEEEEQTSYAAIESLLKELDTQSPTGRKTGLTNQTRRTLAALRVQLAKTQMASIETIAALETTSQEERLQRKRALEDVQSVEKQLKKVKTEAELKQAAHAALETKLQSVEESLTTAKDLQSESEAVWKKTRLTFCKLLISFEKPFRFMTYNNKAITMRGTGSLTIEEYTNKSTQHFHIEAVDDDGSFRLYVEVREPKPKTIYAGGWTYTGPDKDATNAAMEEGKGHKFQMTLNKAGDCRYVVALNFSFLTSSDLDEALAYLLAGFGSTNGSTNGKTSLATSFSGKMAY